MAANPQLLPQILMALEQSSASALRFGSRWHRDPGLTQVIRENPEAFMRLLAGGAGGGGQQDPVAAMLAAAQGGAPAGPPPGQQVVRLTPEEGEAVQRCFEAPFEAFFKAHRVGLRERHGGSGLPRLRQERGDSMRFNEMHVTVWHCVRSLQPTSSLRTPCRMIEHPRSNSL